MQLETATKIASEIAEDTSEAELVLEIWKNRTLSGTIAEQIQEAHAIASYKRTQGKTEELKRALASKDNVNKDGTQAQRKPSLGSEPKLNANDKTVLTGYTWDGAINAYKKTIAGGRKTLFVSRDLKTRWVKDAK